MPEERSLEGKTLLLVDGSSYLYRAYHAMPDLRGPEGGPTGALYGMINMLRRMRKEVTAEYSACVFDAKGKTFRDDWYADYKANRPSMPEDLARQIEPIHVAVRALGWPLLMIEGVEADDVIGTLSTAAEKRGMNVIVSTGDKDLAQLVSDHVTLINTMTNEKLDREGVIAKFGVPPERIIDYLSLIGDTVDNVPGVEKCGPKTAIKWLTQYETLDGIVAHADEIKGAVGDNLRRALDFLPMAKKLVTVERQCDLKRACKAGRNRARNCATCSRATVSRPGCAKWKSPMLWKVPRPTCRRRSPWITNVTTTPCRAGSSSTRGSRKSTPPN
jgi:DNA polymerase-1